VSWQGMGCMHCSHVDADSTTCVCRHMSVPHHYCCQVLLAGIFLLADAFQSHSTLNVLAHVVTGCGVLWCCRCCCCCCCCSFAGVDIALFSAGGSISKKLGPAAQKAGAVVSH
jgi:hypothetical protein